ncbi:MAG: 3-dehydroquinate synthase [Pirellulaceae bacterium]
MSEGKSKAIDIKFSVPFVHRLRVTHDVAEADFAKLLDVLQPGGSGPAKVLLIAETPVADASDRVATIERNLNEDGSVELVAPTVLVDGGEVVKNSTDVVKEVLREINRCDLDRRSYIIAIGGGAMLDAVGYAAAVAHRGIRLVRLPTTTLAQGDSGVGVKNAINYFGKKNWVGTFAVPWAVINDSGLLTTLSDRDFQSGFSESVKVSLLKDRGEFEWLCRHADEIRRRDMTVSARAIHRSCMLHLLHITEGGDPFEMLEARPLDFGHWSAHKLEPLTDYQIRHGEAVGIGVAIDCIYSSMKHGLPESDATKVCECLARLGMRLWHDSLNPVDRLMQGLEEFRQHLGGQLTITMLRGVGDPINVHQIDEPVMMQAIKRLKVVAAEMESKLVDVG